MKEIRHLETIKKQEKFEHKTTKKQIWLCCIHMIFYGCQVVNPMACQERKRILVFAFLAIHTGDSDLTPDPGGTIQKTADY